MCFFAVWFPHPSCLHTTVSFLALKVSSASSRISYKWNHTMCTVLCLTSFTLYSIFDIHILHISSLFPFIVVPVCSVDLYQKLFLTLLLGRHSSYFQFGAITNNVVYKHSSRRFYADICFQFSWKNTLEWNCWVTW
jgi:hypothetical protein